MTFRDALSDWLPDAKMPKPVKKSSRDDVCTCGEGQADQDCPYQSEINNESYTCNCCEYCTQQCCDDI